MKKLYKLSCIIVLIISLFTFYSLESKTVSVFSNKNTNKYKWNLSDIYSSDSDWDRDYKILEKNINRIQSYKGKLTRGSRYLYDALNMSDNMSRMLEKMYAYAYMSKDTDTSNNKYLTMCDNISYLVVKLSSSVSFIEPEILSVPKETIDKFVKNNSKLKPYEFYLNNLYKSKEHMLSDKEERILSLSKGLASTPEKVYTSFKDIDRKTNFTPGEYSKLLQDDNRETRKQAFVEEFESYKKNINVLASALSGQVKKDIFYSKARNYKTSLEASLDKDNIDVSLYNNLIIEVNNKLDVFHKYVALRKKILKLDEIHYYDMYNPLIESDKKIEYDEAKNILMKALVPLGKQYVEDLEFGIDNRWVDVYSDKNKRGGAYSWGSYDTHPYVLLNYNNTLNSVSTFAHEMGHAMNNYYSAKNQEYVNYNYPIFTAEVASITNEALLFEHLIKNAKTKNEKIYYIQGYIDLIRGSIYTQAMYAEFEKIIHDRAEKGEALTSDNLNKLWANLMKKYYGKDFYPDDICSIWWSRIPHFYSNFYVYKYATGCCAAISLSKDILSGKKEKYLDFLAAGGSDYPIEILKKAGVDMNDTKCIKDALNKFETLVDELEKLTFQITTK
ncbi:MAG: oligoendopeptidase F [Tepidibacter sp.]|uniref:oligoendopeptidase F n=1 Tax=Tepidibacter sp. TaxID=2529387 RepID=UPI0025CFEBB1|nr:oligoendopeptidase F [Tepidibacter sp.]MCT4507679.1 oligoendopeptidase F [Tepidibacter sp.]